MANKQKTQTTLNELYAAKRSIHGRLSRLHTTKNHWREERKPSPIKAIGVFDDEIDNMENILTSMKRRLDNATITVEL